MAPARAHNPNDAGSIPAPATRKLGEIMLKITGPSIYSEEYDEWVAKILAEDADYPVRAVADEIAAATLEDENNLFCVLYGKRRVKQ